MSLPSQHPPNEELAKVTASPAGANVPHGSVPEETITQSFQIIHLDETSNQLSLEQTRSRVDNQIQQIVELCQQFEQQWTTKRRNCLSTYIEQVDISSRKMLFRNLLKIDLRRRQDVGEVSVEQDYMTGIDEYDSIVREEFLEVPPHGADVDVTIVQECKPPQLSPASQLYLGDYELESELGRGAMGVVFQAKHRRHGSRVALKTLPLVDGDKLHRFKKEFRDIADISHPNLVGLHTLQCDGGQWFLTMDLVDGESFRDYVRPQGQLNIARLRNTIGQLVLAVDALHQRQIVHRDLKPTNVMVTREGKLLVLDFGLVLTLTPSLSDAQGQDIAGTPAYMAPEQFRSGGTLPASDWYAVGVMLYESLAGEQPFRGSIRDLFQAKQFKDPPPINFNVPEDLKELCFRLLQRDPNDRPVGQEILAALGVATENTGFAVELRSSLVGRSSELQMLEKELDELYNRDEPRSVFVRARSGEGKTILVESFLSTYRRDPKFTVLAGRCYDRETMPFKALDRLTDALASKLLSMSDRDVVAMLTRETSVLAQLFPVLNRVPQIAALSPLQLENLELSQIRGLASSALRALLKRLAENTVLICFLDDLQWGDSDSAELLIDVLSSVDPPRLLLLGTLRLDEAQASRFMQTWDNAKELLESRIAYRNCMLQPLSEQQCIDLVISLVGRDDAVVRKHAIQIWKESGGNPFFASELANTFNPDVAEVQTMQIDGLIQQKLAGLPPEARDFINIVCVSGKPIAAMEASQTAGQSALEISMITRMRTDRIIRFVESDSSQFIDTYHDRIRETVLREMPSDTRRSLHKRIAEQILNCTEPEAGITNPKQSHNIQEASGNEHKRIYDLAYHFFQAEDSRAFDFQLRAGAAASKVHAYEDALQYLRRAEELKPTAASHEESYQLQCLLAKAYAATPTVEKSIHYYREAIRMDSDPIRLAESHVGLAQAHMRLGDVAKARESFIAALGYLGEKVPRHTLSKLARLGYNDLKAVVLPRQILLNRSQDREPIERLLATIYHYFWVVSSSTDGLLAFFIAARNVTVQRSSNNIESAALAYSNYAYINAVAGTAWKGRPYRQWVEKHLDKVSGEWWKANIKQNLGACHFFEGNFASARRYLVECLDFLELSRDWQYSLALHWFRHLQSGIGDANLIIECSRKEIDSGIRTDDLVTQAWGKYGAADGLSRRGEYDEAIKLATEAANFLKTQDTSYTIATQELGRAMLQASLYEDAAEILKQNIKDIVRTLFFVELALDTVPLLGESLAGPDWHRKANSENRQQRAEAKRSAKWCVLVGRMFPTLRAHCFRVRGRIAAANRQHDKAKKLFDRAVSSAEAVGTRYELARAVIDRAVLTQDPNALQQGMSLLSDLNCVLPRKEHEYL